MTIAASVASGSFSKNGARNNNVSTTRAAMAMLDSWLFALDESFAAVFERLPPTTIPLESPAPAFATPRAMNSWLLSSRSPYFRANELAAPYPSEKPISATASAPAMRPATSELENSGMPNSGSPCGMSPTMAMSDGSTIAMYKTARTTTVSAAGSFLTNRSNVNRSARLTAPTIKVGRSQSPIWASASASSWIALSPVTSMPRNESI